MIKFRITKKRVFLFFLFLFFLAVSNLAGGAVGFYQGYDTAIYFSDSDAYSTLLALKMLREDNSAGAIDLLETRLDSEIIQCGGPGQPYKTLYNIYWVAFCQNPEEARSHLLSSVEEYRSRYPSTSMSSEIREKVAQILKKTAVRNGNR
jgi:hypothetical protein